MLSISDIAYGHAPLNRISKDPSETGQLLEIEALARPVYATNAEGKRIADDYSEHEPDWAKVAERCKGVLRESPDLRAACYYAAALMHTHGLGGFVRGLEIITQLQSLDPASVYPRVEPGDASGSTERWFTIAALGAPSNQDGDLLRILDGLRSVALTRTKEGILCGNDLASMRSAGAAADPELVARLHRQWDAASAQERSDAIIRLKTVLTLLGTIENRLLDLTPDSFVPPGTGARPLVRLQEEIQGWLRFLDPAPLAVATPSGATSVEAPAHRVPSGVIQSRADAILQLQKVKEFFVNAEPGSPVPYFVDRAITLVDRDFMTLLNELVPDAVARFQMITGLERKGDS